jgi:hypothetical protein
MARHLNSPAPLTHSCVSRLKSAPSIRAPERRCHEALAYLAAYILPIYSRKNILASSDERDVIEI